MVGGQASVAGGAGDGQKAGEAIGRINSALIFALPGTR